MPSGVGHASLFAVAGGVAGVAIAGGATPAGAPRVAAGGRTPAGVAGAAVGVCANALAASISAPVASTSRAFGRGNDISDPAFGTAFKVSSRNDAAQCTRCRRTVSYTHLRAHETGR